MTAMREKIAVISDDLAADLGANRFQAGLVQHIRQIQFQVEIVDRVSRLAVVEFGIEESRLGERRTGFSASPQDDRGGRARDQCKGQRGEQ